MYDTKVDQDVVYVEYETYSGRKDKTGITQDLSL